MKHFTSMTVLRKLNVFNPDFRFYCAAVVAMVAMEINVKKNE